MKTVFYRSKGTTVRKPEVKKLQAEWKAEQVVKASKKRKAPKDAKDKEEAAKEDKPEAPQSLASGGRGARFRRGTYGKGDMI